MAVVLVRGSGEWREVVCRRIHSSANRSLVARPRRLDLLFRRADEIRRGPFDTVHRRSSGRTKVTLTIKPLLDLWRLILGRLAFIPKAIAPDTIYSSPFALSLSLSLYDNRFMSHGHKMSSVLDSEKQVNSSQIKSRISTFAYLSRFKLIGLLLFIGRLFGS
jgi:hypothetical protein